MLLQRKSWKRRFFILTEAAFAYYKDVEVSSLGGQAHTHTHTRTRTHTHTPLPPHRSPLTTTGVRATEIHRHGQDYGGGTDTRVSVACGHVAIVVVCLSVCLSVRLSVCLCPCMSDVCVFVALSSVLRTETSCLQWTQLEGSFICR